MQTHADKKLENQSCSTVAKWRNEQNQTSAFQFEDNRPEAIQMRKLQQAMNNSLRNAPFQFVDNRPEVVKMKRLQEMANNSPLNQKPTHHQKMANGHASKQKLPIQKKNNTGLPDNLKSGIENLAGYSMYDVKVHYNSDKPAQLSAHAYAQGTDIHLGPGQEKYLPHEVWHVVQQKQGRVKPTVQLKDGVNINNDLRLEKEADMMGGKAMNKISSSTNQPIPLKNSFDKTDSVIQGGFCNGCFPFFNKKKEEEYLLSTDLTPPGLNSFTITENAVKWTKNNENIWVQHDGGRFTAVDLSNNEIAEVQYEIKSNPTRISIGGITIFKGVNTYKGVGSVLVKAILNKHKDINSVEASSIVGAFGFWDNLGYNIPQEFKFDTSSMTREEIEEKNRKIFISNALKQNTPGTQTLQRDTIEKNVDTQIANHKWKISVS